MTTQVMHTITDPESAPISGAQVIVDVYPDGPGYVNTLTDTIVAPKKRKSDANGLVTFDLVANTDIVPAGTVYRVRDYPTKGITRSHYITVPDSGGPYWLGDILTDPPATIPSAPLSVHLADTAPHVPAGFALATDVAAVQANLDAHTTNGTHDGTLNLSLSSTVIPSPFVDDLSDATIDQNIIMRVVSAGPTDWRGLDSPNTMGRVLFLRNEGTDTITIIDQAATSFATNRFDAGGSDFLLLAGCSVMLVSMYAGLGNRRWVVMRPAL